MRLPAVSVTLIATLSINLAYVAADVPTRSDSILIHPLSQPGLPSLFEATLAAATASLNISDIQCGILIGMKNKKELFYFFHISDAAVFKKQLPEIHGRITTTVQLLDTTNPPITAVNIAFSQSGLNTLGVIDDLGDPAFSSGQFADAAKLGDPGTDNWIPAFANTTIHGVFLIASNTSRNVLDELEVIRTILINSTVELHRVKASARPGSQEGHEHFGYMDGISQPAINGFTANPTPGQAVIDPGRILLGEKGDSISRPAWAIDGSFLVFRQLDQLVPEFNDFIRKNSLNVSGLTPEQGSELLGARMVGRWKSGAPVDISPLVDDPILGADPNRNNDFTYAHPGEDIRSNQTRCPFAAHARKARPRADFNTPDTINHIIRAGIPYGVEVTPEEAQLGKTQFQRGLAFVSFQSEIKVFQIIQQSWSNNPNFPFDKNGTGPGVDAIVGALAGQPRNVSGLDPSDPNRDITLIDFIVSRGGGYFLTPSLSALAGRLAS